MAEGALDFWPLFGDSSIFTEFDCDNDPVAPDVLDTFGIPYNGVVGGDLGALDIKHMDAIQAIKLSLMEASANNKEIYEPYCNADGEVEFVAIGQANGMQKADIYYEMQTGTYVEECSGVLITGGKPIVSRLEPEWSSIWGDGYKEIFDSGFISTSCLSRKFSQYATIVFQDPHISNNLAGSYKDGIDNFYESKDPWETLIGYVTRITFPNQDESPETTITRNAQSKIPIDVSNSEATGGYRADLGELQDRPEMPEELADEDPACFANAGEEADPSKGVLIPIPSAFRYEQLRGVETTKVDHLIGISAVYVVGREVKKMIGVPREKKDGVEKNPGAGQYKIRVQIDESQDKIYKLSEGEHYQIAYTKDSNGVSVDPYIVFANNSREREVAKFGNDVEMEIDKNCVFYRFAGSPDETYTGSLLPTTGIGGYLVRQIFAVAELSVPSITVYDPRVTSDKTSDGSNSQALYIANHLDYEMTPMVIYEPPAPIAFNGSLIDQEQGIQDHDPTTTQDFSDTELEKAIDRMDHGGGMTLTFSFLDEQQVVDLSDALYDYMNSRDGSITTYICGPESEPILGGYGPDSTSVVNEILYSYSDSNAYTISVTCGPKIVGDLAQIGQEITYKMTESVQAKGIVIEDLGNNIHFKVKIEGYHRDMIAINCTPVVIRVGDTVDVTVHNNPVEA
jgi:hypothetical protein